MNRTRIASMAEGGLNWESLPLKLFAGGNAKFWNPADIDFSRDRADWERLTDDERSYATRLCAELFALSGGRHYTRNGRLARTLAGAFAGTALRPPLPLALETLLQQFTAD